MKRVDRSSRVLIDGKKALVTGGSRGIGSGIVKTFLQNGASVYYISRKPGPYLDEYKRLAEENGAQVVFKEGNVADEGTITATVKEILEESGGLDILVNNAGVAKDGLVMRMSADDWNDVMNINLTSAFYISKVVSRSMVKRRRGAIVNVTSIVGLVGNAGQSNYAASKAGLIGFTKSLAREIAGRNVRVNAVAPGYIQTDMTGRLTPEQQEGLKAQIPMGRVGTPEDVANVVMFLASDLAGYVTGQVIRISGGMGM
ncbi:MAG: 3-oxoacyl-[acyl-carrier-protein] reductase [Spirochaetaceae bacterium]